PQDPLTAPAEPATGRDPPGLHATDLTARNTSDLLHDALGHADLAIIGGHGVGSGEAGAANPCGRLGRRCGVWLGHQEALSLWRRKQRRRYPPCGAGTVADRLCIVRHTPA